MLALMWIVLLQADVDFQPVPSAVTVSNEVRQGRLRSGRETRYLQENVDLTLSRLPTPFRGHDLQAIHGALLKRRTPTKGEFETTREFQERIQLEASRPLYGSVLPDKPIAIVPELQSVIYDADAQQLTVRVPVYRYLFVGREILPLGNLLVASYTDDSFKYEGQTAFGAKTTVTREETRELYLVFNNDPPTSDQQNAGMRLEYSQSQMQ